MTVRLLTAGARAVLLEVDTPEAVPAWRATLLRALASAALPAPAEVVPGARTVLFDGVDPAMVRDLVSRIVVGDAVAESADGPLVEVPVVYDGADLGAVAACWEVPEREVVVRHTGTEFRVAFCGFAPGFPYLRGLEVDVPRRSSPRPSVPAGSVALAGRYCGIYPTASPGGWQLIGRTSLRLFDVDRDPPALLPPGVRVRFVEVDELPSPPPAAVRDQLPSARSLTVVKAAGLATVQDHGRLGFAHLGVPRAGALDPPAAALANRLVGNPPEAAVIETTLAGVTLRASAPMVAAVTGAGGQLGAGGRAADRGAPVLLRTGDELAVGAATTGVRAYIAVAGGITVAPVLGSRSRDLLSGLGPAPLATGTVLPVGSPYAAAPAVDFSVPSTPPPVLELRVWPGPRLEWFGDAGLAALTTTTWQLSPTSNRIGFRLAGPPVPRLRAGELDSEGIVLGSVQVPPDGQPVVLHADHPTTGGYPVIAVVEPADLALLAQARPGTPVHLRLADRSDT